MPRSWQSRMTQIRIECLKLLANTVSSSSTALRASGSRARAVGLVMRTCRGWKPTDVAHHPIPYDVGARFAPRPRLDLWLSVHRPGSCGRLRLRSLPRVCCSRTRRRPQLHRPQVGYRTEMVPMGACFHNSVSLERLTRFDALKLGSGDWGI